MRKNKITYETIMNIIDNHIEAERNLVFVCEEKIKNFIKDYVLEDYGLEPEYSEDEANEYYVTLAFDGCEDDIEFYIEDAKGLSGEYKLTDCGDCDYFIFIDMDEKTVDKKLIGEGTWSYCELDEICENCGEFDGACLCDEVDECNCENCCGCDEICDETELEIIHEAVGKVLEVAPCPNCTFDAIFQLAMQFKQIGFNEGVSQIKDYIDYIES